MKRIRILKLLYILIIVAIVMDFVPVKMAKKIQNTKLTDEMYICKYVTATDGSWMADKLYNTNLNDSIYINVEGTSVFNSLNEISNINSGTPIVNTYIFQGKIEKRKVYEDVSFNWLKLTNWDVVYPVQRQSIRSMYVSDSFLTIYDFDWFKYIRQILGTQGRRQGDGLR